MTILLSFWSNKSILTSHNKHLFFLNCKILPTSKTVSLHVKGVCVFGQHLIAVLFLSVSIGRRHKTCSVRVRGIICTNNWARFFCFYKEQPLNLIKWGHGTHNACKNQYLEEMQIARLRLRRKRFHFSSAAYQTILCYISCLYFVIGSTMVRRLVSTLPGWAFTQKCCFLLAVMGVICFVYGVLSYEDNITRLVTLAGYMGQMNNTSLPPESETVWWQHF